MGAQLGCPSSMRVDPPTRAISMRVDRQTRATLLPVSLPAVQSCRALARMTPMPRRRLLVVAAVLLAAASTAGGLVASAAGGAPPRPGAAMRPRKPQTASALVWRAHELGPASLSAVACASTTRCFAFGLGGAFLASDDGGRAWTVSRLTVTARLTVLATTCPTASECVAVAERATSGASRAAPAGVALVSHDAGGSWQVATVRGPAVSFLGGLSCPGPAICAATAADPLVTRASGFLLESADGGTTWTLRRSGPLGGLRGALACWNPLRCVASGGPTGIVTTSNGGRRWTSGRLPIGGGGLPGVVALACPSATTCVAGGVAPHPGYPVLLSSNDAGADWRVAVVSAAGSRQLLGDLGGGSYTAVSCSGSRCAAVGDTIPEVGLVAESTDGGRTWVERALGPGGSFAALACGAASGCLAAGTTANGAATLAVLGPDLLGPKGWSEPYVGPGTDWSALSCPTSLDCVAAGAAGPVPVATAAMVTLDGGAHWSPARLPAGLLGITALACPTTTRCLALADVAASRQLQQEGNGSVTAVLASSDGGVDWGRVLLPGGPALLDALSCPTMSVCVAVGATPQRPGGGQVDVVLRTTDGGARWHTVAVPPFPPPPAPGTSGSEILGAGLTSVSCFSARSCLAGGPAGVLSTTDGAHWRVVEQTPGPTSGGVVSGGILFGELQLLACADRDRCLGAFSTPSGEDLRRSTDGGRTWRTVASGPLDLTAISCPSPGVCFAAGSGRHGGLVLESMDAGRTFEAAPLPALVGAPLPAVAAPSYTALACARATACMALGAGAVGEVATATSG